MDQMHKLAELGQFMDVEIAEEGPPAPGQAAAPPAAVTAEGCPIHRAAMPNGQRISLLKTVLTSACERNCNYCAFRAGRDFRRQTFKPDELARQFEQMARAGLVEGLFLSSGVAGGAVRTQDRLLDTAEILRLRQGYTGYLHLKIMPGAERDQVLRAMQLADRVSVNLEAPTGQRLQALAPQKVLMTELLQPLRWVEEIRRTLPAAQGWKGRWPSSTTQFVVGGVGENDAELLRATDYLYHQLRLKRAYYSGFHPVQGTPLEGHPAVDPWRSHRLYQASFLLRDYGFDLEDFDFDPRGFLALGQDPKTAWAQAHLSGQPLEINRAGLAQLLRIPGIGPRGARTILASRRKAPLHRVEDLKALGIQVGRAAPFILIDGRRPP
ncbi:MAG: radical SAM protein, partial [Chloroflexi bacterium]|nr:radical SAM protein [Chloroflexota bacterium]